MAMLLHYFILLSVLVKATSQQTIQKHLFNQLSQVHFTDSQFSSFTMNELDHQKQHVIQKFLIPTLIEVFNGPLSGKSIVIVLDTMADQNLNVNQLLSSIPATYVLLREQRSIILQKDGVDFKMSHHQPNEGGSEVYWPTAENESTWSSQETMEKLSQDVPHLEMDNEDVWQNILLTGAVLIYMKTGETAELLHFPPSSWSLAALLIVSTTGNCDKNLLQTELASRTSSLAIICPAFLHSSQRAINNPVFTVHTRQPFHPHRKWLYIGRCSSLSTWEDLFVDRFQSFYGYILYLAGEIGELPYFYTNSAGAADGINMRMLDTIAAWLDFIYVLPPKTDVLNFGEKVNGTWNGFLGDIWSGTKDIPMNGFAITYERAKDFDFTQPYSYEGYGLAAKQPLPLPRWQSVLYPFGSVSWGALVLTVIVGTFAFYWLQLDTERMSYMKCLFFIIKSLVNQSVEYKPKKDALRVFLTTWWLSTYVIGIIYACNLISFFTVPVYPEKITTLKQLADSSYRLCMLDYGDFVPEALRTSSHYLLSSLGRKLDLVPSDMDKEYYGEEKCLERVMESPSVHLEFFPYLKSIYSSMGITDKVYYLHEVIYENSLVIFFKRHNAWKYKFDQGIRRFVEFGLFQKWNQDIMRQLRKNIKVEERDRDNQPLSIAHLQGPFFILLFSLPFSLFVLLLEYIFIHIVRAKSQAQRSGLDVVTGTYSDSYNKIHFVRSESQQRQM